ncbi:MAG: 4Fe-4S dicluster domain-containing protein [Candidatus Aegiribacteria sp.]|nr:4Fe-4S dicluster domain-containing protein [Candidatus Aegiribacteria sp.]
MPLDKTGLKFYFIAMLYIKRGNLFQLLKFLSGGYRVFVPSRKGDNIAFTAFGESEEDYVIGEFRSFEPLKAFYFLGREKVAVDFSPENPRNDNPPCIVGVKSCDLKGLKILDFVFMDDEYGDPTYMKARTAGLIISADCTKAAETCFCTAMGVNPWPEQEYDINLSEADEGFVVEIGSDKGQKVIDDHTALFQEATEDQIHSREHNRTSVKQHIEKNVRKKNIPPVKRFQRIVRKYYESDIWLEEAAACVECGACNVICPTCHCFLLYDQKSDGSLARYRIWDSCMIKDFARVAGGENPRNRLWMRLRNRFEKKFDYFPSVADEIACTGCGRCIAACPGKIDIRQVLAKLGALR